MLDPCTLNGDPHMRVALYSVSDDSCYHLPPIPGPAKGIRYDYEGASLDGKLYVLGGSDSNVYVFEFAGQREWKQCASMANARQQFGCCVKDGKIYVFGGTFESGLEAPGCGSEGYQPKEDVWSPITPMPSFRANHKVTAVGEELFVHGGTASRTVYDLDTTLEWRLNRGHDSDSTHHIHHTDAYHPVQDKWRIVEHFTQNRGNRMCMVRGKIHRLKRWGATIQGYDFHANSWGPKRHLSFGVLEPNQFITNVCVAIGLDDEIWQ